MMRVDVIGQYLYQQYQDDLDLRAFVAAFNSLAQGYVDWANTANLPIYTALSGNLLDWVGAGIYGLRRPVTGFPSGAIYNAFDYNTETYGSGSILSVLATDDVYKRILTWKHYAGDGVYVNINWLKRRVKRFILGINGTAPDFGETSEISVIIGAANEIEIVVDYPADAASVELLVQYINSGVLDTPYQYNITARAA